MMSTAKFFFLLGLVGMVLGVDLISEKMDHEIIDRDDDYWYVKTTKTVNRPSFPAYIRFYNTHTAESEYEIDVSRSGLILYYNSPPQIIFRTTGHFWTEDDSYYVTLDEGVLFSDPSENSSAYRNPNFWRFNVIRPPYYAEPKF